MDASHSGQMNLLEEILDSLNTSAVEEGKLSTAKSLDFFRSMEDLDYKSPVCQTDWRNPDMCKYTDGFTIDSHLLCHDWII